ncbi:MAG: hypothetical protein GKR77_01630 [Legionellales bacterium]|nr:hypothetical protein [Legionellales bacterium]
MFAETVQSDDKMQGVDTAEISSSYVTQLNQALDNFRSALTDYESMRSNAEDDADVEAWKSVKETDEKGNAEQGEAGEKENITETDGRDDAGHEVRGDMTETGQEDANESDEEDDNWGMMEIEDGVAVLDAGNTRDQLSSELDNILQQYESLLTLLQRDPKSGIFTIPPKEITVVITKVQELADKITSFQTDQTDSELSKTIIEMGLSVSQCLSALAKRCAIICFQLNLMSEVVEKCDSHCREVNQLNNEKALEPVSSSKAEAIPVASSSISEIVTATCKAVEAIVDDNILQEQTARQSQLQFYLLHGQERICMVIEQLRAEILYKRDEAINPSNALERKIREIFEKLSNFDSKVIEQCGENYKRDTQAVWKRFTQVDSEKESANAKKWVDSITTEILSVLGNDDEYKLEPDTIDCINKTVTSSVLSLADNAMKPATKKTALIDFQHWFEQKFKSDEGILDQEIEFIQSSWQSLEQTDFTRHVVGAEAQHLPRSSVLEEQVISNSWLISVEQMIKNLIEDTEVNALVELPIQIKSYLEKLYALNIGQQKKAQVIAQLIGKLPSLLNSELNSDESLEKIIGSIIEKIFEFASKDPIRTVDDGDLKILPSPIARPSTLDLLLNLEQRSSDSNLAVAGKVNPPISASAMADRADKLYMAAEPTTVTASSSSMSGNQSSQVNSPQELVAQTIVQLEHSVAQGGGGISGIIKGFNKNLQDCESITAALKKNLACEIEQKLIELKNFLVDGNEVDIAITLLTTMNSALQQEADFIAASKSHHKRPLNADSKSESSGKCQRKNSSKLFSHDSPTSPTGDSAKPMETEIVNTTSQSVG